MNLIFIYSYTEIFWQEKFIYIFFLLSKCPIFRANSVKFLIRFILDIAIFGNEALIIVYR